MMSMKFSFCIHRSEEEISIDAHLESILASECTMIVLDRIETIIQVGSIRIDRIYFQGEF